MYVGLLRSLFDLHKLYINPLLNFLDDSGLGGKIGNINVCAPTCADDVALIAYNPLDIQTVSDRVIPIWVALSTTGIILLSIFQKPSFVTIFLLLDLTGRITLLAGCSWYPVSWVLDCMAKMA
jgi:hypothetical protein